MKRIPIARTEFTDAEYDRILEPLKSGWVVQGKHVKAFEEKWSAFTGAAQSIATTSCTTALHLLLAALGIGPGDEVIVPAFTWVATANAVEAVGARPVFCDIGLDSFNIDGERAGSLITERTRAIIPVHLFGLAADMDRVSDLAEKHGLHVIEDAACGFGARYDGVHVGNFGIAGCFSFHPRKAITTGEGGMITTNDDAFAEKLRAMRDHGATMSDLQRHQGARPYLLPEFPYLGFNFRMTDIQASIGSSQMDRAEAIHAKRSEIAGRYDDLLDEVDWLVAPTIGDRFVHGYQAYVCLFRPEAIDWETVDRIHERRNAFMEYLQERGVSTRPGTHAVHALAYYRDRYRLDLSDCENATFADRCSIAFPIFPGLTEDEFQAIIDAIKAYSP